MSISTLERSHSSRLLTDSEWTGQESRPRLPADRIDTEAVFERVTIPFADGHLVFSEAPPAWFRPILEKICALDSLQQNWDSYGARPLNPRCAAAAIDLLLSVLEPEIPLPAVVPTNRGGLQIEWHRGGIDLEIEIRSPSRFDVAFEDEASEEEWETTLTVDFGPLVPLLKRLTARE